MAKQKGGKREGAGRPKKFNGEETYVIQKIVPLKLKEPLSEAFDKEIKKQFDKYDWT